MVEGVLSCEIGIEGIAHTENGIFSHGMGATRASHGVQPGRGFLSKRLNVENLWAVPLDTF